MEHDGMIFALSVEYSEGLKTMKIREKKVLFIIAILFVTIVRSILTLSLSPCVSTSGDIA